MDGTTNFRLKVYLVLRTNPFDPEATAVVRDY